MINFKEEKRLWRKGYKRVAGLDEAGRGPLAGLVVAAVVCVNPKNHEALKTKMAGIKDSKKLSPKRREEFYQLITKSPAIEWGIGRASEKIIDRINILEATKLAMKRAVKNLKKKPDFLILDGKMELDLAISQISIVKADEKIFSCQAASIIAKVRRDRLMRKYHKRYSQYGFDRHKGYPTKHHREMLKKHGLCEIHRKSFRLESPLGLNK
ncbi:ribonuclease HII [Patescibacteria group bacterium]|nr:ribonuclease HII [Patescibacteria group bacterium]